MPFRLHAEAAPDRLAGVVLVHRAVARGRGRVAWVDDGHVVDDSLAGAARGLGLVPAGTQDALAASMGMPRIALYCGAAIGYPYYAYYTHCLLSLGLTFALLDGAQIAAGGLAGMDLLLMPGGFATWGLDRAEGIAGIDAEIRGFLAHGGALIGSCGGAFYLSQGRPHWLGLIDAKPKYSHEYLQTGAGVVNVRLTDPAIRGPLPESVELVYYHGPAYPPGDRRARTMGRFDGFAMPSRLFIDNPIDRDRFERDLEGAAAILIADPSAGRALVFSPHPEMGDFVRKAIAVDGYVRRYLPIRGAKTMDETLRFYGGDDCGSFRLVLNAMAALALFAPRDTGPTASSADTALAARISRHVTDLDAAIPAAAAAVEARLGSEEEAGFADLLGCEFARRRSEWAEVSAALRRQAEAGTLDGLVAGALDRMLADAAANVRAAHEKPVAEALVSIELPTRLAAAAVRIGHCDRILEQLT